MICEQPTLKVEISLIIRGNYFFAHEYHKSLQPVTDFTIHSANVRSLDVLKRGTEQASV